MMMMSWGKEASWDVYYGQLQFFGFWTQTSSNLHTCWTWMDGWMDEKKF